MNLSFIRPVINYLGFSICWYGLVKYGNAAAIPVLIYIVIHLFIQANRKLEIITIGSVTLIGFIVDTIMLHANVILFSNNSSLLPLWFIMLWCNFSSTLNHALKIFSKLNFFINMILGGVGGVVIFLLGDNISNTFSLNHELLYLIGIEWSLVFAGGILMAKKFRTYFS